MRYKIPSRNWHMVLADSIENANDGDIIEVHNESMKELAETARVRMCPSKRLIITIKEWSE